MRKIGIIPARMAASRFPGKPLFPILGLPMVEHVYLRANMYPGWDHLLLATCDSEIEQFANEKNIPVIMTGSHHTRALDRIAEAVELMDVEVADDDIIVNVQGDEPMMRPDMMDAVMAPLIANPEMAGTILAMHIQDESIWRNPDTVKLVHNAAGEVLYTTPAPVPYCETFTPELMARRIYGLFGFRWRYLREFTAYPETRLEQLEACDSNRVLDMNFRQFIAPYPHLKSFSVDSPEDIKLVEENMVNDEYWKQYK